MSESVQILIAAEDKASGKLKAVGNSVDDLGKRVKDTGGKLKAGTEVVGTFANAFGGSALGAFAGELAQVTERVSAFSEASKSGVAGALAFKAALAGAIAITTFKVGEAIGNWWFETERWKKELEAAGKAAERLQAIQAGNQQRAFSQAREDISLERDPAKRESATQARIAQLERESAGLQDRLNIAREEVAQRQAAADAAWISGNAAEELKIAQQQQADLLKTKDALEAETQALRESISERTKSIEAKKQENALADKSDAFIQSLRDENEMLKANKEERLKLEAARNTTPEQRGIAEELLKEREALRAKAEEQRKAEQEAQAAANKEKAAIERIAELEKRRTVELEARRIELEKGREAAQAYRLEQEGLSRATAERLAAQEEATRLDEEAAGKVKSLEVDSSPQQAVQGRLLTQGTGGDPMLAAANKTVANLEKLNTQLGDKLDKLYEAQKAKSVVLKQVNVP